MAEVVLISQFAPYVEIWRCAGTDEAGWNYAHYGPGKVVEFSSLGVHLSIAEIYHDVNFDEPLSAE